jgi:hypothetical protein
LNKKKLKKNWKIFADETTSVYDFKDGFGFGLKGGKTCGQNTVILSLSPIVSKYKETKVFNYGTSYATPLVHGYSIQLTSFT